MQSPNYITQAQSISIILTITIQNSQIHESSYAKGQHMFFFRFEKKKCNKFFSCLACLFCNSAVKSV